MLHKPGTSKVLQTDGRTVTRHALHQGGIGKDQKKYSCELHVYIEVRNSKKRDRQKKKANKSGNQNYWTNTNSSGIR